MRKINDDFWLGSWVDCGIFILGGEGCGVVDFLGRVKDGDYWCYFVYVKGGIY